MARFTTTFYFTLYTSRSNLFADISATRTDTTNTIIVAEVKGFGDPQQIMPGLYISIGQYIVYRNTLRQMNLDLPLFLALPTEAYYGVIMDIAGFSLILRSILLPQI